MDDLQDFFTTSTIDGWDVILAVLVVVLSIVAARVSRRAMLRLFGRVKGVPGDSARIIANVVKYFVLLVGVGVALNFVGATVQPLTTAAIVAGVVAILVLRGVAGNFGAGLVLQTRGPFKPGDEVELMGYVGTVKELNGRAVVIETVSGDTIHFANGQVVSVPMINRTATGRRRTELEIGATLSTAYDELRNAVATAVRGTKGVLPDPPPTTVAYRLEPDRVVFRVVFHHTSTDSAMVSGDVIDTVAATLQRLEIDATISPAPSIVQTVHVDTPPADA